MYALKLTAVAEINSWHNTVDHNIQSRWWFTPIYVNHLGVLVLHRPRSIYSMCILPGQVFIVLSLIAFFVQSEKNQSILSWKEDTPRTLHYNIKPPLTVDLTLLNPFSSLLFFLLIHCPTAADMTSFQAICRPPSVECNRRKCSSSSKHQL